MYSNDETKNRYNNNKRVLNGKQLAYSVIKKGKLFGMFEMITNLNI